MNAGVSRCSSLIVSRALCAGEQSCWNISQGSVATHLRWGGIFINDFIGNFQLSTSVKELWKSVNIQQRYGQEYSVSLFWLTLYIPFIHSRHKAKDRSLGVGRDIIPFLFVNNTQSNLKQATIRKLLPLYLLELIVWMIQLLLASNSKETGRRLIDDDWHLSSNKESL